MPSSKTLLFVTDLRAGSRIAVITAASGCAHAAGYELEVVEAQRTARPLGEIVAFWNPVGIIFNGSAGLGYRAEWFPKGVPVVHLDPDIDVARMNPDYTVENGDAAIGELAFKALDRPRCKSYAFVGWERSINWSNTRADRFGELASKSGKPFFALHVGWTMSDPQPLVDRLHRLFAEAPLPCGVFAANDDHAAVVLAVCRQEGLRVPDDVSLVGVDDMAPFCEHLSPPLTSIAADFPTAGRLAAQLLVKAVENPALAPAHLVYPPCGVTYRDTTSAPVRADPLVAKALAHIRRHATEGLRAADVVAHMGVSERTAEMRFRRHAGKSITECITDARLERALACLANPRQRIDAIANLCGWSSPAHLKHLFKARFGCSMRDWRKARNANGERRT